MEQEKKRKIKVDEKSFTKWYRVVNANKKLNSSEKLLLSEIISLSKERWYCFATQKTLAILIWKSEDYIKKLLKSLEKKWFIEKKLYQTWMKRATHIYVKFDKIWSDIEFKDWIELKGIPNKDDYIPRKKEQLFSKDKVYWYFQGDRLTSFENFWDNRRGVVNQWRTNGRNADEINIKFQELYVRYVWDLWWKVKEEWREITEREVRGILRGLWGNINSTYDSDDYNKFQEAWEINILPSFWLTWDDWDVRPIRDVILDKFRALDEAHKEKRRKEEEKKAQEEKRRLESKKEIIEDKKKELHEIKEAEKKEQ